MQLWATAVFTFPLFYKAVVLLCKVTQSFVGDVVEVGRLPVHPPVTAPVLILVTAAPLTFMALILMTAAP
jgi:hypothetical protein